MLIIIIIIIIIYLLPQNPSEISNIISASQIIKVRFTEVQDCRTSKESCHPFDQYLLCSYQEPGIQQPKAQY